MQRKYPLLFVWSIVVGCVIGMIGNSGQIIYSSLGVLIKPLEETFAWTRGEISLALTFSAITSALSIPLAGMVIDKFGPRSSLLFSLTLFGLALLIGPLFITTLRDFYLFIMVIAFLGSPTNTVAYVHVISNWFNRRRGLFIGITASGSGLGFAITPLLVNWVLESGPWYYGYQALGVYLLCIILPCVYLLIKNRPEDVGLLMDGGDARTTKTDDAVTEEQPSILFKQAIKTRIFWLLVISVVLVASSLTGILSQLIPMLIDKGISVNTATLVASTMGMSMAVARVMIGFLLDRYFAPHVAFYTLMLSALALITLICGNHIVFAFIAASLMGLGIGAEIDLMGYLASRYFGVKQFGLIFGCIFAAYIFGTGLGPYVVGNAYDTHGNYDGILYVCTLGLIIAASMFRFFYPYDTYLKAQSEGKEKI
ncbi:MAG: MFS transporter [Gammaproteobacteria bacterium]|jgi:MFS family permease|nr:MFS transporter [Gammaproteobacteria bacterium]